MKLNSLKHSPKPQLIKKFMGEFSRLKLKAFNCKQELYIEYKNYIIKTAETYDELLSVLQLRYDVFHRELNNLKANKHLMDWDEYDILADHILVLEKESKQTIACYRVICSRFSKKFYSEKEFYIKNLIKNKKVKLELGRACVDPEKRRSNIIHLIWKGLAEYMYRVNADYVFGCTSVPTTEFNTAMAVFSQLQEEHYDGRFEISPKAKYQFTEEEQGSSTKAPDSEALGLLVPPLLKSYLNAGSKICSLPAIDRDFGCVDLFTVLDFEETTAKYLKKYFSHLND